MKNLEIKKVLIVTNSEDKKEYYELDKKTLKAIKSAQKAIENTIEITKGFREFAKGGVAHGSIKSKETEIEVTDEMKQERKLSELKKRFGDFNIKASFSSNLSITDLLRDGYTVKPNLNVFISDSKKTVKLTDEDLNGNEEIVFPIDKIFSK